MLVAMIIGANFIFFNVMS